jgi:hypothetical protein
MWLIVGAVLMALTAQASHDSVSGSNENSGPACLTRARAHLPGQTMATFIKGGEVGSKRLLFQRGDVVLAIDFVVFDSATQDFLKEASAGRFPEEANLLRRFAQAMKNRDEVKADALVRSKLEQVRLDFRLAEVLDRGAFLIRNMQTGSRAAPDLILRLDYSYECGDRC